MTPGERAVWAAEFVRAMADGKPNVAVAAMSASAAVWLLRDLAGRSQRGDSAIDHQTMVADMTRPDGAP